MNSRERTAYQERRAAESAVARGGRKSSIAPLHRGVFAPVSERCEPLPKGEKAKPGKRTPTKDERAWMDAIVAYGCVACRHDGLGIVPPAVHHILRGGRRIGHLHTLPLCDPGHHQNGQQFGKVSRHPWKAQFEQRYGSEDHLLRTLRAELGFNAHQPRDPG